MHRIDPQIKEWIQDIFVSDSEEFGNLTFSLNFSGIKEKIEKKKSGVFNWLVVYECG